MKFSKMVIQMLTKDSLTKEQWAKIDEITESRVFAEKDDLSALKDAEALLMWFNPITKEMIDAAPNLKYIGAFATGYGKIEIEYAKTKGISVTNVPGYSTESVAEFVFAVLLEHMRTLEKGKTQARAGDYDDSKFSATEIKGKQFGVVGLGSIGRKVAEIAHGFGADVKYWSRAPKECDIATYTDIDKLIKTSDIISINLELNPETEGFFTKERIDSIKPGAIVINTCPMNLLDQDALETRLKKGDITFILDHSDEMTEEELSRFKRFENCIIYPPIAYLSDEATSLKQDIFVENIRKFVAGTPQNVVN